MARYVVLSFGSDAEAERFVRAEQEDRVYIPDENESGDLIDRKLEDYEVVGMFQQPTQFCDCPGGKGRIQAWVQGDKYGWWVCKRCKRPANATAGPVTLMRAVVSQAKDLMAQLVMMSDEASHTPLSVWTKGWGVFGRYAGNADKWE